MLRLTQALAFLTLTFFMTACTAQRIGQGNVTRDERMLVDFEGIEVGSTFNVELRPGPHEVVVEADKNLLPFIETTIEGDMLRIYARDGIKRARALNIYVSMPRITKLIATEAVDIVGKGTFAHEKMELDLSGATDLTLELDVEELEIEASGSTDMMLSGRAEEAEIELSGSSDLEGSNLVVQELDIDLSGSSDAKIVCEQKLKVRAKGSSDLVCLGQPDPDNVKIKTSGAAQVSLRR
jgi:hypothetical protein